MNGGPAFPVLGMEYNYDHEVRELTTVDIGVSVRDYFATKFIAAWIVTLGARHGQPGYSDRDAMWEAHRLGNEQADAMLAERAQ